jgi:uncharacterized membrane protein (DUF4010 family)
VSDVFVRLAIALGLGLLVGLQRERSEGHLAGFRTFALIALGGFSAGLLLEHGAGPWPLALGALALIALLVAENVRLAPRDSGTTTEVAALLLYLVGALLALGAVPVAVVLGGLLAVLLQFKEPLHGFAGRLSDADLRAVAQIALIGLVILPVLPDRSYGPYDVLNPFEIWLVVVLIVGISLASYLVYRLIGARSGTLIGGLLGGLISSTATTASHARRAAAREEQAGAASLVILIASAVVIPRLLLEVSAVAPAALAALAPPLCAFGAVSLALSALCLALLRDEPAAVLEPENPAELRAALAFGALYGLVLLAVAAARDAFGGTGLFAVAAISGLTDVDAITLSTAHLVGRGTVDASTGWRAILIAALANLLFKAGIVALVGGAPLLRRVAPPFTAAFAAGLAILWLWP